jgi:excisionase family DNA binding protein
MASGDSPNGKRRVSDSAVARLVARLAEEGRAQLAAEITSQWSRRPPSDPLLTVRALADFAGVTERTVRYWLGSCDLPAYRVGRTTGIRVRRSDFECWLASRRLTPKP